MNADIPEIGDKLIARPLPVPTDGQFVVVSQTCDIVATIDKEPVIEAFPCALEPDANKRAGYRRSFRWFEIDRKNGLVAHAMFRVAVDKHALLSLTPLPWPDSPARLERFSVWLARRAFRPAIPDPIVDAFLKPLRKVMDKLEQRQLDVFRAFNSAVADIRIGLPENERPPFEINMVLLLAEEALTQESDDAIEVVRQELQTRLDPDEARLGEVL